MATCVLSWIFILLYAYQLKKIFPCSMYDIKVLLASLQGYFFFYPTSFVMLVNTKIKIHHLEHMEYGPHKSAHIECNNKMQFYISLYYPFNHDKMFKVRGVCAEPLPNNAKFLPRLSVANYSAWRVCKDYCRLPYKSYTFPHDKVQYRKWLQRIRVMFFWQRFDKNVM